MSNRLLEEISQYNIFLDNVERRITERIFEKQLLEIQRIDANNYTKKINVEDLKRYIEDYRKRETQINNFKKLQVLLPGNPEIVFKLCLEAIRYDVDMQICIEDFCVAQNTFFINLINQVISECELKNKVEIKNRLKDAMIIKNAEKFDKTICIGNSNLYNRLEGEIENLFFYPYGIFELYSDSEEFEDLKRMIYDYAMDNQFEIEIYDDDFKFEDVLIAMKRDGYKFCSILFSKDKIKQEEFKKSIDSKYVILNENPFKKISFTLNIE